MEFKLTVYGSQTPYGLVLITHKKNASNLKQFKYTAYTKFGEEEKWETFWRLINAITLSRWSSTKHSKAT